MNEEGIRKGTNQEEKEQRRRGMKWGSSKTMKESWKH
jgi:hypothetical protein